MDADAFQSAMPTPEKAPQQQQPDQGGDIDLMFWGGPQQLDFEDMASQDQNAFAADAGMPAVDEGDPFLPGYP